MELIFYIFLLINIKTLLYIMYDVMILSPNLPLDTTYHILLYAGIVKLRNGKYMYQISKTDKRYEMLDKLTQPRLFRARRYSTEYIVRHDFYTLFKIISRKQILLITKVDHKQYYHDYIIVR